MKVIDTAIHDVKIIEPKVFGDERGFFLETFEKKRYQEMLNISLDFVQDNHSRSTKDVLRGLHFQKINPQGKLVRVVSGAVFDVAVDIRPDSKTYGKWVGVELSAENKNQLCHLDLHMVFAFSQIPQILNINVLITIIRNMKDVCFGMMKRSVLNGP